MKKGDLKNRLRRRTADKLYDLARSNGHIPAHLPVAEMAGPDHQGSRRKRRPQSKSRADRTPAR